ncbi:MAG: RiPP maturation radical SAM C-methyltransferase [Vicinamibacteria bacterium]|jgi:ribosomal peptide maturation radical SAM protein 1
MTGGVLLVAMPWEMLAFPSIQLGTLEALLAREGLPVASRSAKLPFWDHCLTATRGEASPLALDDYDEIALSHWRLGLGDWLFAEPSAASDAPYLALLREAGVGEAVIAKAERIRSLVPAFLDAECEAILADRPAVVGFTTTFNQTLPSVALARRLKARAPATWIVFGGANCDGPMGPAHLRAFACVDAVVRGEAEVVLPGLIREVLDGDAITPRPGVAYRDHGGLVLPPDAGAPRVSMDDLPLPIYDEYFARLASTSFHGDVLPATTLLYESGRGCWWGEKATCTFCGLNGETMAFRAKAPDRVARDLHALAARYRRLSFQIVDNIVAPGYFDELFPGLAAAGHDFGLFLETKSNLSWAEVCTLRRAGVRSCQAGLESLSTPILKRMRKGVSALQNVRMLVYAARAGIECYWNLIYGFPGEPEEAYAAMAALVPSLVHLQPPTPARLRLDRFSPYHADPAASGLEVRGPSPHYPLLYPDVPEDVLGDLAYTFDYRLPAGQDPERYAAPLLDAIAGWRRDHARSALAMRQGPGFLLIDDRRVGLPRASYTLASLGRRIYDACEHGATPDRVLAALREGPDAVPSVAQVAAFLDELAALRLLFTEDGRYLALATPWDPRVPIERPTPAIALGV